MPVYSFIYMDTKLTAEPFREVRFRNDEAAKQEAILTAADFDRQYRVGPVKKWANGTIIVMEGDREVVRVSLRR